MNEPRVADAGLPRAIGIVAALNLAYFIIELLVARRIGSVSLFADSADFFEDASVNVLILLALSWSPRSRARIGMLMAFVLLAPATAFLWELVGKLHSPSPPAAAPLSITGLGALAVNLFCAFLLASYRDHRGSLTRAAFLSARNDALANIGIIAAGLITIPTRSAWPDVLVGLGIGWMNLDAAREVWTAARDEHRTAQP